MTLSEMKQKVFTMIEEYDEDADSYTADEDFRNKINHVINQVMYELARVKKIAKYTTLDVEEDDVKSFTDIDSDIYQLHKIKGVAYEIIDTNIFFNESGTAKIFYYVYPTRIDEDTDDDEYTFELTDDVLEAMAYGVAGDILSSDVSNGYGNVYKTRYTELKNQLDPRYALSNIEISGGIDI